MLLLPAVLPAVLCAVSVSPLSSFSSVAHSHQHEVWHDAASEVVRAILIVDIWHLLAFATLVICCNPLPRWSVFQYEIGAGVRRVTAPAFARHPELLAEPAREQVRKDFGFGGAEAGLARQMQGAPG